MSKNINHMEYAIVDIETTGGYASGSGITEIAILIHDGHTIIGRYETLINPERNIPLSIQALTGINNEMVCKSPVFGDVADKVYHLLKDKVFVAHNVNFDYSFLSYYLERSGYKWTVPKLCTVRMSRKIKPGLRSYSLGNLCNALQIPMHNRHRAGGDAEATAILFGKLLQWDTEKIIEGMLRKSSSEQRLPPNLPPEQFSSLPSCAGVYYFKDQSGKVIYVGKALNIKKRVATHFTGNNSGYQRQSFLRNIYSISFEECGTELMALLLECMEIKKLWPPYNRALKKFEPKYALYSYEDQNGYLRLAVGKLVKYHTCIQVFNRPLEAIKLLYKMVETFNLDIRLCTIGLTFDFTPNANQQKTNNAAWPPPDEYNTKVNHALQHILVNQPTFALVDKGRNKGEKSCIWVESGNLYAMGYISSETQLNTLEDVRDILPRCYGNHYMMQLIYSYAAQYPDKVLRPGMQKNVYAPI